MIKISNLNICYDKPVINNGNFHAYKGKLHLIKGESGSGKTTLLYRIGLISDDHDFTYSFCDVDANGLSDREKEKLRKDSFSLVFHEFTLFENYTIEYNLKYYASISNISLNQEKIQEVLKEVNLLVPLDQKVKDLSGGECQRLELACALLKDTNVILLDEPTNSLDIENEEEIFKLLKKISDDYDKCIIITSHSLNAENYADVIYEIKNTELKCIKDCINVLETVNIIKMSKIRLEFLLKNTFQNVFLYKKKALKIISMIFFLMFSVLAIQYYLDVQEEKSIHYIESLSENQLFISSQDNNIYVDSKSKSINEKILEDVDMDYKLYPYFDCKVIYGETIIDIIPFFDQNDLIDKLEYKYSNINDDGLIYSNSAYNYLKRNNRIVREFDEDIVYNNERFHYRNKTIGILKEGVKNPYTPNKYFIYMKYETLYNLIEKAIDTYEYTGFTLFTKDLNGYLELCDILKEKDVDINDSFSNVEAIKEVVDNTNTIKIVVFAFSFIIINLMIIYTFLNHHTLKKKEYIVNKLSGMLDMHVYFMIFIENSIYVFSALFVMCLIYVFLGLVLSYFDFYLLLYYLFLSVFITVISSFIFIIDFKNISIEGFLRN